jgi:hypothetical protein
MLAKLSRIVLVAISMAFPAAASAQTQGLDPSVLGSILGAVTGGGGMGGGGFGIPATSGSSGNSALLGVAAGVLPRLLGGGTGGQFGAPQVPFPGSAPVQAYPSYPSYPVQPSGGVSPAGLQGVRGVTPLGQVPSVGFPQAVPSVASPARSGGPAAGKGAADPEFRGMRID